MMCDLLIAADTAKFGQPEIKLGVLPGMGGSQRLTRAIGKAKAMDLILTGRNMDADEAERSGLVSRVVPADELLREARAVATTISEMSLSAARMAKRPSTARSKPRSPRACSTNAGCSTPRSPPPTKAKAWPHSSRSAPELHAPLKCSGGRIGNGDQVIGTEEQPEPAPLPESTARPEVGPPLHVHRHRTRAGVPMAVDDPVAAAARTAVPRLGQRGGRCDRLRDRRVGGVAGPVHALEGQQPARATDRLDRAGRGRCGRHGGHDRLVPHLAGRRPRPDGRSAPEMARLSGGGRAGHRGVVRPGRDRNWSGSGSGPGPAIESGCAAQGFGCRGGGSAGGADHRDRQRRGGAVRDAHPQQHVRGSHNEQNPDNPPPKTPLRSGGPGSLVSWASLGNQGRVFVGGGPTTEQLSAFNGAPAVEPIRAYAGLESADGIRAAADLAAGSSNAPAACNARSSPCDRREPDGSTSRRPTPSSTCSMATPRSSACSTRSYAAGCRSGGQGERAPGRAALFEAVSARVERRRRASAPKLVVFGESLGSFGGEAPSVRHNIEARTDGALFSGPTFSNTMWEDVTATVTRGRRSGCRSISTGRIVASRPGPPT